jgi:hypothetical protein
MTGLLIGGADGMRQQFADIVRGWMLVETIPALADAIGRACEFALGHRPLNELEYATLQAMLETYDIAVDHWPALDIEEAALLATRPFAVEQTCEVCGCTDSRACMTDQGPCFWVAPGLCSACAGKMLAGEAMPLGPLIENPGSVG